MNDSWIRQTKEGVRLRVRVKPRSGRDRIEPIGPPDVLIIRLTAPPLENKANNALRDLIARKLRLPRDSVQIVGGEHARLKTILVSGRSEDEVKKALDPQPKIK